MGLVAWAGWSGSNFSSKNRLSILYVCVLYILLLEKFDARVKNMQLQSVDRLLIAVAQKTLLFLIIIWAYLAPNIKIDEHLSLFVEIYGRFS